MDGATLTEEPAAPDIGKRKGGYEDNHRAGDNDFSEQTLMIWGPALMLGPILPAMLSMVTVFVGYIILHGNPIDESGLEKCGYPIDTFLSVAIANAHLLLLVFSWSFMGFNWGITIRQHNWLLLRPFSGLKQLAVAYGLVFSMSVVTFIYGSWAVSQARADVSCAEINSYLLSFTTVLVVIFWIGVAYGSVSVLQLLSRGSSGRLMITKARGTVHQAKAILEQLRPRNDTTFFDENDEINEDVIREKFLSMTSDETGMATIDSCKKLIPQCGIILTRKELKLALKELDGDNRGKVYVDDFVDWWRGYINDYGDEDDR